jgi:polysaccharide chain length determinant protein (PEP-CTERM system associated)
MLEILAQIKSILRGVWHYRWTGLITSAILGSLGFLVSVFLPNQFEATARVYVDTQSILQPLMKDVAVQPNIEQQVSMMSRTLLSRPTLERVMRTADLDVKAQDQRDRDKVVDGLMKDIEFKPVIGAPNLFTLSYRNPKPETAKAVVQSLLSIFVETSLSTDRQNADQAVRFLDEQIKGYEQKLLQAENALKEFKIKNIGVMPNSQQDYVSRITDIENQTRQARLELRQAENARDSIKRQLATETPTLDAGSEDIPAGPAPAAPVVVRITEAEERYETARRRLDDLRSRYTEEHPDIAAAKRAVDQARPAAERDRAQSASTSQPQATARVAGKRNLVQTNPVYKELKIQLADNEANVASLRAKVSEYDSRLVQGREQAVTVPKVEAEFTQLTRDYEINRQQYDKLIARRESALLSISMRSTSSVAEFRIVDPPRVSPRPVAPNRVVLLLISLLVATGAGLAAAYLRDQTNPTFFDLRSVREATAMPILGGVSYITNSSGKSKSRLDLAMFSAGSVTLVMLFLAAIAYFGVRQFAQ